MTPVGGIISGSFAAIGAGRMSRARPSGGPAAPKTVQAVAPLRTDEPVEQLEMVERYVPRHQRPNAAFLAHLIATKEHAPQTRERRRTEPQTAIAIYGAAVALTNSSPSQPVGRRLAISA